MRKNSKDLYGSANVNPDSVKDRLKNLASNHGKSFQEELVYYGLERTIYRLSKTKYAEHFVLKGGIFLYALFDGNFARATSDIDLLAEQISNDQNEIEHIFYDVFSIPVEDAIIFDLQTLKVSRITEFKAYPGVNISITGYLDKTEVPISIDIGFGDVIYPERALMKFPSLLKMEPAYIYSYSIYSVVSEKIEAIISLGFANSRYKDFYDIYILAGQFEFDKATLTRAVKETFSNRKTKLSDMNSLTERILNDPIHQKRWEAFMRKKKTMNEIELDFVIFRIRNLINPVIEDISTDTKKNRKWNPDAERWG